MEVIVVNTFTQRSVDERRAHIPVHIPITMHNSSYNRSTLSLRLPHFFIRVIRCFKFNENSEGRIIYVVLTPTWYFSRYLNRSKIPIP